MSTCQHIRPRKRHGSAPWAALFLAVLVFCTALFPAAARAQMPAAGTNIENRVAVTYTDPANTTRTVASNLVATRVLQVASLTLVATQTRNAGAGAPVAFAHTLTNTGNGPDSFALTLVNQVGDDFDLSAPRVRADANCDGVADGPVLTTTATLAAGASICLVVEATLPTAAAGLAGVLRLSAASAFSSTVTAFNDDTARVAANAVINVFNKTISANSGAPGSGPYTYTIVVTNTGGMTATSVAVSDLIPAGMTYVANSGRWSSTGATVLGDGAGGDPAGIAYDYNVTTPGAVTAVITSLAPNASQSLSFQVAVNTTAPAGVINNTARLCYDNGTGPVPLGCTPASGLPSNIVPFTVVRAAAPAVVANGSSSTSANGAAEPVTVASIPPDGTAVFNDYVWNLGDGADSFDISTGASTFPAGTAFMLFKSDGVTPLVDTNGNGIPDTGTIPSANDATCTAANGYVADAVAGRCGYRVVVRAVLPASALGGPFSVTLTAASRRQASVNDPVENRLLAIVPLMPVLAANQKATVTRGAVVRLSHTLTNGSVPATFALAATDLPGGYDFDAVALYADADGDGVPDSATPITTTGPLGNGQVFRFVVQVKIPASVPLGESDRVRISAISSGPAGASLENIDTFTLESAPVDACAISLNKAFEREAGPVPSGRMRVTISYFVPCAAEVERTWTLVDRLQRGIVYVPGSARWSQLEGTPLKDGPPSEVQGPSDPERRIQYDFGITSPDAVTAVLPYLTPGSRGQLSFYVEVRDPVVEGDIASNVATAYYRRASGYFLMPSNYAQYRVIGTRRVMLTGQTLELAEPGAATMFVNELTNIGSVADTYNITLSGSSYPAGTRFELFQSDGTTPLADTNGDGIPDTGVVPPGGKYRIVVKASLPSTAAGGPFSVDKTARSIVSEVVSATAQDRVRAMSRKCRVVIEPDNRGRVAKGGTIVYAHLVSNVGNCESRITFPGTFKTDSLPDWKSEAFIDELPAADPRQVAGLIDAADTPVSNAAAFTLRPGESQRILIRVTAPAAAAIGDTDTTTFAASADGVALTAVKDVTVVAAIEGSQVDNEIRNYTNELRLSPTVWAVIGRNLYLGASAPACNADPTRAEQRTVIITGRNGERETFVATETGPNTGVFLVDAIPVRAPPVTAGNGLVEGRAGDVMVVELTGCGVYIATALTIGDAGGIVFDSASNEPVTGATVSLVAAIGGDCTNTVIKTEVEGALKTMTAITAANGSYSFPAAAAGNYCLRVSPPAGYRFPSTVAYPRLPPGRNVYVTAPTRGASYGDAFAVDSGPLAIDLPVDAGAISGLVVEKSAQRSVVELGETLDYRVAVRNRSAASFDRESVLLEDRLPMGFSYVAGSARIDGKRLADPTPGAVLVFELGPLRADQEMIVTYRVHVGPGAKRGDAVNRVRASYRAHGSGPSALSNEATATVSVQGGVFDDRAFVLGKVYADCNANGVQDAGERGVPGVRLVLEDGTSVITDGEGKYSLYGLPAKTHVLKVDPTTLPGMTGRGETRFVDLKSGELHRADFALRACDESARREIDARRNALADAGSELEGRLVQRFEADAAYRSVGDPRSLPASGTVVSASTTAAARPTAKSADSVAPVPAAAAARIDLETEVATLDNALALIGLADGARLPFAQANIRVKGMQGAVFKLAVNGVDLGEERVGKRVGLAERELQAWEYVGVNLRAGENEVRLRQYDPFGNQRGEVIAKVLAPGPLARLVIEAPESAFADGATPVRVRVRLADAGGLPVAVRTPLTLDATSGTWRVNDASATEAGVQTFVEGGEVTFDLIPAATPGEARLRISSGTVEALAKIDFLPDLRSLIASGLIEGVLSLRRLSGGALVPARAQDGFEQELRDYARRDDGGRSGAARAAVFLKGKVQGKYLLTLAYDSDKETRERLFRDIQPDEYYPVYGDASERAFDAQSTRRLYVRVDDRKSWLLYGDYTTAPVVDAPRLATYNRSLTGGKGHYENDWLAVDVFASRDSTRQIIDELRANGTSGPYQLSSDRGLVNSEKVEILTRDRNQPARVISTVPQSRFVDYDMEPLTGRILFRAPVRSLDEKLNPISIRITYEIDQGGRQFWVSGVEAQARIGARAQAGASFVKDANPVDPFTMTSVSAAASLAVGTTMKAEVARTDRPLAAGGPLTGNAARVEVKHHGESLDVEAFAAKSDTGFDNPGAPVSRGREEANLRATLKVDERTTLRVEALRTGDRSTGGYRQGAEATLDHGLANGMRIEGGVRYVRESDTAALPSYPNDLGEGSPAVLPNAVTSVRAKLTAPVPGVANASAYGELEVDVHDSSRKLAAVGGEYLLGGRSRIYGRHEFISSLSGVYGLNGGQRQNATVFGVDADYTKDGKVFSEYRVRDAISGGDAEAAIGLRKLWRLADGVAFSAGYERVHVLSGKGDAESTAVTTALEYTANPRWKGTTRLELRDGATTDSLLWTLGLAARVDNAWTLLGRNTLALSRQRGTADGEALRDRLQVGLAYRDTETNRLDALGRIEHRTENDTTQPGIALKRSVELVSVQANYQPRRPFTLTSRLAAKWVSDRSNGLATRSSAQLLSGRASWEFAPGYDFGVNLSTLLDHGARKRQTGLGMELGYRLTDDLWLAAGFNVFGYRDEDFSAGDYTDKGLYLRLRYKFDENLLNRAQDSRKE